MITSNRLTALIAGLLFAVLGAAVYWTKPTPPEPLAYTEQTANTGTAAAPATSTPPPPVSTPVADRPSPTVTVPDEPAGTNPTTSITEPAAPTPHPGPDGTSASQLHHYDCAVLTDLLGAVTDHPPANGTEPATQRIVPSMYGGCDYGSPYDLSIAVYLAEPEHHSAAWARPAQHPDQPHTTVDTAHTDELVVYGDGTEIAGRKGLVEILVLNRSGHVPTDDIIAVIDQIAEPWPSNRGAQEPDHPGGLPLVGSPVRETRISAYSYHRDLPTSLGHTVPPAIMRGITEYRRDAYTGPDYCNMLATAGGQQLTMHGDHALLQPVRDSHGNTVKQLREDEAYCYMYRDGWFIVANNEDISTHLVVVTIRWDRFVRGWVQCEAQPDTCSNWHIQ